MLGGYETDQHDLARVVIKHKGNSGAARRIKDMDSELEQMKKEKEWLPSILNEYKVALHKA